MVAAYDENGTLSRSPVRQALAQLQRAGYIDRTESGRYQVARPGPVEDSPAPPLDAEDPLYLAVPGDVVDGAVRSLHRERADAPARGVPGLGCQLVQRMDDEGWAASLPGYGWEITVAACSRNEFLLDCLVRINKRRRLMEYHRELRPEPARIECAEHGQLVDLTLSGDLPTASAFLRSAPRDRDQGQGRGRPGLSEGVPVERGRRTGDDWCRPAPSQPVSQQVAWSASSCAPCAG